MVDLMDTYLDRQGSTGNTMEGKTLETLGTGEPATVVNYISQ